MPLTERYAHQQTLANQCVYRIYFGKFSKKSCQAIDYRYELWLQGAAWVCGWQVRVLLLAQRSVCLSVAGTDWVGPAVFTLALMNSPACLAALSVFRQSAASVAWWRVGALHRRTKITAPLVAGCTQLDPLSTDTFNHTRSWNHLCHRLNHLWRETIRTSTYSLPLFVLLLWQQ